MSEIEFLQMRLAALNTMIASKEDAGVEVSHFEKSVRYSLIADIRRRKHGQTK